MPDIFSSDTEGKNQKQLEDLEKKVIHHPKTPKKREIEKLPSYTNNPLSAFSYYPDNARFINEDPEEKIILLLRKHPITNIKWMLTGFAMLILPSFLTVMDFFTSIPGGFQLVLLLTWYLITLAFVFEKFLSWFFNVNILTDERIIEVDFYNLVYREITDAKLDQVQDVTSEMSGALHTFFNYGNVYVQTASEVPKIKFDSVPQPDKATRILRELIVGEEQEKIEGRVR